MKVQSNLQTSTRLFANDFLEMLTKTPPWLPLVIFLPAISWLVFESFLEINAGGIVLMFAAGVLLWTLFEYCVHRFLFHYKPSGPIGERMIFLFHGIHHIEPNDSYRLVMPPSVSVPASLAVYAGLLVIVGPFFVKPLFAGFISGYLVYDMAHYAFHHLKFENGTYKWLKRYHLQHHFNKKMEAGFGVSSPLWDIIFRTLP